MSRFLPVATLLSLAVAGVLMIVFDQTLSRIVGVLALLAFIVLGVFTIATPEYLSDNRDRDPGPG